MINIGRLALPVTLLRLAAALMVSLFVGKRGGVLRHREIQLPAIEINR